MGSFLHLTFILSTNESRTLADLKRLFGIIRQSGFRGYLPLETLGAGDPREKLPRFLDEVRAALA